MAETTPPQCLADSVLEPGFIEKDLPNWESFHDELQNLHAKYDKSNSQLLFRGQNDSEFHLTTTLERAGCGGMSFDRYYRLAVSPVRPAVETFTGVKWDVPNFSPKMEHEFYSNRELFSLRLSQKSSSTGTWSIYAITAFHLLFSTGCTRPMSRLSLLSGT